MPRVTFEAQHKTENPYEYPKLFLDKGERARVLLIEPEPLFEYVHTLRAPQIVDGRPVTERVTQFGKDVEQLKYDFVGRHICVGDYATIAQKGVDVVNCPVCAASTETDAVRPPDRRFAMHVVRYATKPGSFTVADPFQVQLVGWAFGDKLFNQLVDYAQEWKDLKKHDLLLGPCEVKQFQKFDIAVAGKAEWLEDDERKALVVKTYKENQSPNLSALIGRKLSREQVEDDLEKVLVRHRQAHGIVEEPSSDETAAAINMDDLLSAAPAVAVVADAASEAPKSEGETLNFDDLLGEL